VKTAIRTANRPEGVALSSGSLFVAVRASGIGHRGGTLRVLAPAFALISKDPAIGYGPQDIQILTLTNDGLTTMLRVGGSNGYRLVPDLAVSVPEPTEGGRSYTFKLRPGIRYSTGAVVRPQDFRPAIERSLVEGFEGIYFSDVVGASRCLAAPKKPCSLARGIVADPAANTVTFHLTEPDPDFPYKLALNAADAVPVGTPLHLRAPAPATGPYRIASYNVKHGVRLVRNARFREWSPAAQPAGFPDEIVIRPGGTEDTRIAAVARGSADIALAGDPPSRATLDAFRAQHAGELRIAPGGTTYALVLNTSLPPFDNLKARQAVAFAVDRQRLSDLGLGRGLGRVTCQVLPPDFAGYERYCPYTVEPGGTGAWSGPDLARALKLVRASGTAGQSVSIWIPPYTGTTAGGRYVVSLLDRLGYKARLRVSTGNPYGNENAKHVQSGFEGWYSDYATPTGFFGNTLTCASDRPADPNNTNAALFCDPAIDREIARARSLQSTDPEAAASLWAKVDRDTTDQAPWVAFANGLNVEFVSRRVGNYQYNPQLQTLLGQLWVK
jgi:peptide/nickel transport system substrate-binding protein